MRMVMMLTAAPLLLAACQSKMERDGVAHEGQPAQPSGQGATRTYAATGFTGVDLRGADDVDVRSGAAFAVTAEGDPKILDELKIEVVDGTLRVGRKNDSWGWGNHDGKGAKVHVTLPRLTAASVAGSGNLTADRGEGDFSGSVAGSGNLAIAALQGGAVELSIAGSGDLSVAGTAGKLDANIAGSGDIDAGGLTATGATVSIAGSGNVKATVNGEAKVSLIGSGDAELGGGARCSVSKMGSGEARCG